MTKKTPDTCAGGHKAHNLRALLMTGYKHLKNKLIVRYIKNPCVFVVVSFIRKKARGGHQSEETCFTKLSLRLSRVNSRFRIVMENSFINTKNKYKVNKIIVYASLMITYPIVFFM